MTIIEAISALDLLPPGDAEIQHCEADRILLEQLKKLGHWPRELAEAYERAEQRIGFMHS